MTKAEFLKRLETLSDERFEAVAPYLEADLDAIADFDELHDEIAAAFESKKKDPLLTTDEVLSRARKNLQK